MSDSKQLTVREAANEIYVPSCPEIARRTVTKIKHECTRWEETLPENPPIGELSTAHFVEFRRRALAAGLSAAYIECIVSDVSTILKACVYAGVLPVVPLVGKRLKRKPKLKHTPSVEDLAAAYSLAELAEWPVNLRWSRTHGEGGRFVPSKRRISVSVTWWQGVFVGLYLTAFRKSDLLNLTWKEIEADRIVRRQKKTGTEIAVPVHPVLRAHLDRLPKQGPMVFGRCNCPKQHRRELRRLCEAAGVRPFGFQAVRRLAAQMWHRARPGCGTLILGHRFRGSDAFYLDPYRELEAALPTLEIPAAMASEEPVNLVEAVRTMDRDAALKALQAAVAELAGKEAT